MKKCFVITGYGQKTDPITGKQFDLDKLFKNAIKPVFESQGYACHRAIDLNTSGAIDNVMFENILHADFVVVDLTTFNANVMYELGVRHVLRPYSTILMCEKESMGKIPFNIKKLVIHPYEHLGRGIDFDEIERVRILLKGLIVQLEKTKTQDSPVYDVISGLQVKYTPEPARMLSMDQNFTPSEESLSSYIDRGEQALKVEDYSDAKDQFELAFRQSPNDPYLIKRLALTTYKGNESEEGLQEALNLLNKLNLNIENDTETYGLFGAIHKRLYQLTNNQEHLEQSISYYQKGYVMHDDYYNGINYAQMKQVQLSLETNTQEQNWLKTQIDRTRKDVMGMVNNKLSAEGLKKEDKGWLTLTKAEVMADMGDFDLIRELLSKPQESGLTDFQISSLEDQIQMKEWKVKL